MALEVRGLTRGRMVRDVSFDLRRGEILGFAGLMGAGRTEVARVIFGADPREAGEIIVHGKARDIRSPARCGGGGHRLSVRRPQALRSWPWGSTCGQHRAASLERFSDRFWRVNDRRCAKVAADYIESLAIRTPSDRQEVRLLSGGNQQKVVIAKWLLRDCDILIFDEPTRGIDVGAKAEIYRLLQNLAAQGKAIIVISSELPEVLRLSHRIAVMCEGPPDRHPARRPATSQQDIMRLATLRDGATGRSTSMTCHSCTSVAARGLAEASGAQQKILAFASLIVLLVFFSVASPNFLQTANILAILQATIVNGVLAVAATLVIITGGIDLSVGTLMTFTAVIAGVVLTFWGMPLAVRHPAAPSPPARSAASSPAR